jgi:hypothetical protein
VGVVIQISEDCAPGSLRLETYTLYMAYRDPECWYARAVRRLRVCVCFSPIDLIPTLFPWVPGRLVLNSARYRPCRSKDDPEPVLAESRQKAQEVNQQRQAGQVVCGAGVIIAVWARSWRCLRMLLIGRRWLGASARTFIIQVALWTHLSQAWQDIDKRALLRQSHSLRRIGVSTKIGTTRAGRRCSGMFSQ